MIFIAQFSLGTIHIILPNRFYLLHLDALRPLFNNSLRRISSVSVLFFLSFLSGCFIPTDFKLELNIPGPEEVNWDFEGNWQFFFADYDPRRDLIPQGDISALTEELSDTPGNISIMHVSGNIWKQKLSLKARLRDAANRPNAVTFPMLKADSQFWLVSLSPGEDAVLLQTVSRPSESDIQAFRSMGYESSGTLSLTTTGTVLQLSGPPLSKSWFDNSYSVDWNLFRDESLKVLIKW